jgi:multisubunit Na+/H+ antiporter MnhG subunit
MVVAGATIVFFYLTAPVAAQVLARAAYRRRLSVWGDGRIDEIREPRAFADEPLQSPEEEGDSEP